MTAGRVLVLTVTLFASAPLFADLPSVTAPCAGTSAASSPATTVAPASTSVYVPLASFTAAPASATSAAALMLKAFPPGVESCRTNNPGIKALLEPAALDEPGCLLSPYGHGKWGLCPPLPPSPVTSTGVGKIPLTEQPSFLAGDQVEGGQHGDSIYSGKAQLDQGDQRITASQLIYNADSGLAHAQGDILFASPKMMITGPSARYDTNQGSGSFDQAVFELPGRHGHGTAELLNNIDEDHSQLFGVHYTTCPPGMKEDWYMVAPDMELEQSTDTGEAHDVTIHFMGLPIFWSPYLNFPLTDDRKSGFLGPEFSFDVVNGFDISAPYYYNLAENYDATLTPRIITKRGDMASGEFRYLTDMNSGTIDASYLPHDQLADRERSQLSIRHETTFTPFLDYGLRYDWVSDPLYLEDLGHSLTALSSTFLERHMVLRYDDEQDWTVSTRMQDFQVIDPDILPTNYPYRRLPQTVLQWQNNDDLTGPQYGLYSEVVRFQRDCRIGSWRSDVKPYLSFPFSGAGAYFTPGFAVRSTDYDLNNDPPTLAASPCLTGGQPPATPFPRDHFTRNTPIFSLDTGLDFDRVGDNYIQTLEPRLYYLRVPFRDQSQVPLFDSVEPEFSFLQLFNDNRFVGADRQGDANQVSYAVTSRLLRSDDGAELLQADLGQIRYFSARKVQLDPTTPADTALFSDVVADVLLNLSDVWSLSYSQNWDPATRQTDLGTWRVEYHPAYHQVLDLAYRFNRDQLVKQTDVAFDWPLGPAWSVVGRWNYDIVNHVTLDDFIGFEYDSCCWDFQIVHRRFITRNDAAVPVGGLTPIGKADGVFFFELQLKGLGTVGRHLEQILGNGILGYSDNAFTESDLSPPQ